MQICDFLIGVAFVFAIAPYYLYSDVWRPARVVDAVELFLLNSMIDSN